MEDLEGLTLEEPGGEVDGVRVIEMRPWPNPEDPCELRYRYSCAFDGDDLTVFLTAFRVVRRTPKGAWIDDCGLKRFVLDGAGKRFAHQTREDALHSFMRRSVWRQRHAARSLEAGRRAEEWTRKQMERGD